MSLKQARIKFTRLLPRLLDKAFEMGYDCALDEATERLTEQDKMSDHMKGSLHHIGLAVDLLLYFDGFYLKDSADYKRLGDFWKTLDPFCRWGGEFGDGGHFSFSDWSIPGCVTEDGRLRK